MADGSPLSSSYLPSFTSARRLAVFAVITETVRRHYNGA